jgi:anaerobic selenocysteine-containing dehydrogenase
MSGSPREPKIRSYPGPAGGWGSAKSADEILPREHMPFDRQDAVGLGVKIVAINPLHERGLERFINPQAPSQMLTGKETKIASSYYQVKNGGDIAVLFGTSKALIEADDLLKSYGISRVTGDGAKAKDPSDAATVAFAASIAAADKKHVLDHDFIKEHTAGFEEFAAAVGNHSCGDLERVSGRTRDQMVEAAKTYAHSDTVMMVYGMGLTQHLMGVQNVHMVANLVLLRGNIGKPCANTCAVRSHSNEPGGFGRPLPARGRKWVTSNKKANFITPGFLFPTFDVETSATDMLHLTTLRSNDQFNTTVYGYGGRFRGVEGTRWVVFMNPIDVERLGLVEGNPIDLITATSDGEFQACGSLPMEFRKEPAQRTIRKPILYFHWITMMILKRRRPDINCCLSMCDGRRSLRKNR